MSVNTVIFNLLFKKCIYRVSQCSLINGSRQYSKIEKGPGLKDFIKKDKKTQKTPLGKLDEIEKHPYAEKEPLSEFKDGINPETGEVGGPKGPEPTRYGDWERKGRVSDF